MTELLSNTQIIVALTAIASTIISVLLGAFASVLRANITKAEGLRIWQMSVEVQDDVESFEKRKREHLKTRISEVTTSIKKYGREATIHKWSNNSLVFGQYVVGIALTSSFLQETLTPTWIGILGLIVLITTATHQRYRPDLKKRNSIAKVALLRSTIRKVEDELAITSEPPVNNIIKRLTSTLNKIEIEEAEELIEEDETNAGLISETAKTE